MRLTYEFEFIDQSTLRNGSKQVPLRTQRGHHDEVYSVHRVHRARAAAGLTDRLSAELALPWVSRSHGHIHRHGGRDVDETWRLNGLGDLQLELRYDVVKPGEFGGSRWTAISGAKFPTGPSRLKNGENDQADPPIQPGSESFDYFFGGAWSRGRVFAATIYRIPRPGFRRYKQGDFLTINAGGLFPVARRLEAVGQLNFTARKPDAKGDTSEEVDKTGGDFLFASIGPQVTLAEGLTALAVVQLPLYQRVNKVQLTSRWNLLTSLSYRFTY